MKKNFKRTLAKVMAVALTVSMVGVASTDADAAKKIKLSSKSISVAKGATKKVTIKNVKAKKVKKLTVKSADKKIATVKKSGKTAIKVTGKKAGKSTKVTVKVKVGKKTTKLTLKVKVTKAKAPATTAAPAASASAAPAASASATPAASASATPAASASAAPATNAPASEAPATEAPATNVPATNVPATVETTDVANIQLGGKQSRLVSYFAVSETGSTEITTNKSAQYGGVYTYFDVNCADLTTLKTLSFDLKALYGDATYKHVYLLAANPDSDSPNAMPAEISYSWETDAFTNVYMVEDLGNVNDLKDPKRTFSVDFDQEKIEALTDEIDDLDGKIRFSIFVNLGNDVETNYTISNVKLLGTEKFTEGFEAPSAKIDNRGKDAFTAATLSKNVLALNETASIDIAPNAKDYGVTVNRVTVTSSDPAIVKVDKVTDNQYMVTRLQAEGDVTVQVDVTTKEGCTAKSSLTVAAAKSKPDTTKLLSKDAVIINNLDNLVNESYSDIKSSSFTKVKDTYGNDVYKVEFTKSNQRLFLDLKNDEGETFDLSKYSALELVVSTKSKMCSSIFNADRSGASANWWSNSLKDAYSFEDKKGSDPEGTNFGVGKIKIELSDATNEGALLSYSINYDGTFDANADYYIYAVALVPKAAD